MDVAIRLFLAGNKVVHRFKEEAECQCERCPSLCDKCGHNDTIRMLIDRAHHFLMAPE